MKKIYIDLETRAIADLSPPGHVVHDAWCIHRINVPLGMRGKGLGSALLDEICRDADSEGQTLWLWPVASFHERGLDQDQLVAWYARRGFRKVPGPDGRGPYGYMRREPRREDTVAHTPSPGDA